MAYIFRIIIHLAVAIQVFGIQVRVQQGILLGEKLKTVTGKRYYSFKGIPFAKPPVGKLRFKAPEDPEPWDGVRDATDHGSVCPQTNFLLKQYRPASEDCLFLNVYTKNLNPKKSLAVLVFMFVGEFLYGSANVDFYGPDFLVTKDVVVVTIHFRVGALGFLSTDSCEVPGNAGLKDQVAALKWVQNNIRSFGGDPNRVTIVGKSAGAASVGYHLLSEQSRGLFQRAIAMSGVPSCDWGYPYQPVRRAYTLGKMLGFETENPTELIDFLQSIPHAMLINTTAYVLASEKITDIPFRMHAFTPVIEKKYCENSFISTNPIKLLEKGAVNKVDVMFGYNDKEALVMIQEFANQYLKIFKRFPEMFVPSKILVHATPDKVLKIADKIIKYYFGEKEISVENIDEFINYASNATFVYDIQSFFRRWPRVGKKYFYKFVGNSNRNYFGKRGAAYGVTGASHVDDIFYLFDPKKFNLTLNPKEYQMVELMTTAFTNFVKYGNPTPEPLMGVRWPQYNSESPAYAEIGQELTVKYAPDEDDFNFWQSCYHEAELSL